MSRLELPGHDLVGLRAANPGPFTLTGTNSWLVSRNPTYLVDPGPALPAHLEALADEIRRRGGLAGIALTHDHPDHVEGLERLRERFPQASTAAARGAVDALLRDGSAFGPLSAIATPGHAPDHLAFRWDGVCFSGDAVLGEGSVFIAPGPGALSGYLAALRGLLALELKALCPAHGPIVTDPQAKLQQYLDHRLEREQRLLAALAAGLRSASELLDEVWADAPAALRPAAAVTLAAHLDKLREEGRLPPGVERPRLGQPAQGG